MSTITVNCKKTGLQQAFEVRFSSITLTPANKMIERPGYGNDIAYLQPLRDSLKQVAEAGWSSIKILPLTEEGAKQPIFKRMTYHYRGGKRYITCGQSELDKNPFIVRGKSLLSVSAHVWKDCTGERKVRFVSEEYSTSLTECQQKELCERYGQGLLDALTEDVLEEVKAETRKYILAYSKQELNELKERIADLEKFQG